MTQINDLVVITSSRAMPVRLVNDGGVFVLEEVDWKAYPLEGDFVKGYPLTFNGSHFYVADGWDKVVRGEVEGDGGEGVVETHRREYRFGWGQAVTDWQESGKDGVFTWEVACLDGVWVWRKVWRSSDGNVLRRVDYDFRFPGVSVPGGYRVRFEFPGDWRGRVVLERKVARGVDAGRWEEWGELDGSEEDGRVMEVEEGVEDMVWRFRVWAYGADRVWVEQPVVVWWRGGVMGMCFGWGMCWRCGMWWGRRR